MAYVPKGKRKPYTAGRPPKAAVAKARQGLPPSAVYLPDERQLCYMLAARGASDAEIEQLCGVQPGTMKKWRELYPDLDKAIEHGRLKPDAEVLYQTYRNATGFEYEEDQAVGGREATILRVRRYARPSVEAQKFWLINRQREQWKQRESHEVGGPNGKGIPIENRNTLIDSILAMISSKPDPEKPKGKRA